jgi:hypothetical protein
MYAFDHKSIIWTFTAIFYRKWFLHTYFSTHINETKDDVSRNNVFIRTTFTIRKKILSKMTQVIFYLWFVWARETHYFFCLSIMIDIKFKMPKNVPRCPENKNLFWFIREHFTACCILFEGFHLKNEFSRSTFSIYKIHV